MEMAKKLLCFLSIFLVFGVANAAAEPLRIGVFLPLSGGMAATAEIFKTGVSYVVDKYNKKGGWDGEPIKVVFIDDGGKTQNAANRFKQLANDGVNLIMQGGSSSVALALDAEIKLWNKRNPDKPKVLLVMGAEAKALTGSECDSHVFRFATNVPARVRAIVKTMSKQGELGTSVYSFNQAYTLGREVEAAVRANANEFGYKVVGSVLHEIAKIQDFSPYVDQIRRSGAKTVITGNWGPDLILFMKAIADSGIKLRLGTFYLDQPGNVASGGKASVGHYVANIFNLTAAGEAGEIYRKAYHDATGTDPVYMANFAILATRMLTTALDSLPRAERVDVDKIVVALEAATLEDWPHGKVKMRASDHQAIMPVVVSEVSRDATYKADGTEFGFKPVAVLQGEEVFGTVGSSECKMGNN